MPIARKREFIMLPASSAGGTPPPAVMIDSDANWADPAYVIADMTIACRGEKPACRAITPNDRLRTKLAIANGIPSRRP